MRIRNGQVLVSRKTGEANTKIVKLTSSEVQLLNTATGRRWNTTRENVAKSFTTV